MTKKKSNLSETAQFVKSVMDDVVMPEIDKRGLATEANGIISKKLPKDDSKVVEFERHVDELRDVCLDSIPNDDPEKNRKRVVGRNFCNKLKRSVNND